MRVEKAEDSRAAASGLASAVEVMNVMHAMLQGGMWPRQNSVTQHCAVLCFFSALTLHVVPSSRPPWQRYSVSHRKSRETLERQKEWRSRLPARTRSLYGAKKTAGKSVGFRTAVENRLNIPAQPSYVVAALSGCRTIRPYKLTGDRVRCIPPSPRRRGGDGS
jgi:hypothetical protein